MTQPTPELDPQLRAAFAKSADISASLGAPDPGIAGVRRNFDLGRRYWNEGGPDDVESQEQSIAGPTRQVPVVIYRPRGASGLLPVFVYLHGGGFRLGSHWSNDRQMREMAHAWGGVVISADYLHVPEHVFPSAVDETAAVLQWLHGNAAALGLDGDRIAFGGSSAGAVVAFGAAVGLGGVPWLRAAVGIVGAFSAGTSTPSMQLYGDAGLYPDAASVAPMFNAYVPDPALRNDPRANLLAADAKLLPPTFLAAAEFDIFRDASAAMAQRLELAGRLHAFNIYPGMGHLFFGTSRSVDRAAQCVRDVAAFLAQRLPCDAA
ncbi:MAG: alpha/beta hydrolase fold domain-containing protein [Burkholderiaceae bacterium]|nr:alpha/beta hydrolase fold domain-containing protein [Burkholderiaceae bacterium]